MFDGSGDPLFYVLSPDRMEYRVVSGSQTVMAEGEAPRDSDAPDQPQADSSAAPPAAKAASARPGPSPGEAKAAGERGRALYFGGKNTVKDEVAAFPWLLRAAEGGDAFAMSIVGGYYWFGRGNVVEDHSEALRWLRSAVAAEPGRACEWCSIGDILFDGQENVRDEREALQAYEQCFARAEDDSRRGFAAYDIGQVYERWNDADRAVEWFEKSARFKPERDLPRKKADALRAKR